MITDIENKNDKEILSMTITFLRFPLIVMVVFIHAYVGKLSIWGEVRDPSSFPIYNYCATLISDVLCRVAVPLFYLISGYLFFFKTNDFDKKDYLYKLKKRGRSLLIPYLIWNTIYILLFFVAQSVIKIPTNSTLIVDYSIKDWFYAYWGNPNNMNFPICYPLWFIRDLIVVMIFTPILYFIIKKFNWFFVIVLGLLWMFFKFDTNLIISCSAFFFFSVGALFGIKKTNFAILSVKTIKYIPLIYSLVCFFALYNMTEGFDIYIKKASILFGLPCFIGLSAYFIKKGKLSPSRFIASSSFFIFAYHAIPLSILIKLMLKYLPYNTFGVLLNYFVAPLITIVFGPLIYGILKKYFPKITNIITGGR